MSSSTYASYLLLLLLLPINNHIHASYIRLQELSHNGTQKLICVCVYIDKVFFWGGGFDAIAWQISYKIQGKS